MFFLLLNKSGDFSLELASDFSLELPTVILHTHVVLTLVDFATVPAVNRHTLRSITRELAGNAT